MAFSVRVVEYTVNLRDINENHLNNNLVGGFQKRIGAYLQRALFLSHWNPA